MQHKTQSFLLLSGSRADCSWQDVSWSESALRTRDREDECGALLACLASLASLATYHQLLVGTGDYKRSVVCNSNKPGFWRMGRWSEVIRGRRIICGLSSRAEIISVLS